MEAIPQFRYISLKLNFSLTLQIRIKGHERYSKN